MAGVLNQCGQLVRLRWTMLGHAPRGLRIARWLGWPAVAGLAWLAVALANTLRAQHDVLLLGLTLLTFAWVMGPVFVSGSGMLRGDWFRLLPLDRRALGAGLLAAAFAGYGPAATLLALCAIGLHAALLGQAALLATMVGIPVLLIFLVALSRVAYALMGAALGSRLGIAVAALQYGALLAASTVGWLAVGVFGSGLRRLFDHGLPEAVSGVLRLLPASWPVLAAEAAAVGRTGAAIGWLAALVALTAVLVVLCLLLLAPQPVRARGTARGHPVTGGRVAGRGIAGRAIAGRRALQRLVLVVPQWLQGVLRLPKWRQLSRRLSVPWPSGPAGAVAVKELRQWRRDPWRTLELQCACWFGVFITVLALVAGRPDVAPFAGVAVAVFVALAGCNLFGLDGTALWLTVVGEGAGTIAADIRGRQLALVVLFGGPALVIGALAIAVSGQHGAWPLLGLIPAVLGAGAGLSTLLSVVAATPGVDPRHRSGPNDAGDVTYQVWLALFGTGLLAAPAAAVAAFGAASHSTWLAWATIPVGLVNGLFAARLLGRSAAGRLAARLPETFVRIRYGKEIAQEQQPDRGGGLLDRMERSALARNAEPPPPHR